jgi:hypothetical protein
VKLRSCELVSLRYFLNFAVRRSCLTSELSCGGSCHSSGSWCSFRTLNGHPTHSSFAMDVLFATTVVIDLANSGRWPWACSSYHCAVLSGWVAHLVSIPIQDLYALATATNEAMSTERMAPTNTTPEEQRVTTDDDVQEFHSRTADLWGGAGLLRSR